MRGSSSSPTRPEDVADPDRTLTRAYYVCVLFVIALYVLVAVVAVGSVPVPVPVPALVHAGDYALAEAARPALGSVGFAMIGLAAMLSTASAINATLYGSARLTYTIAKSRELPSELERPIWHRPLEGLFLTAGTTVVLANLLNLQSIATMGSAGFLIISPSSTWPRRAPPANVDRNHGSRHWPPWHAGPPSQRWSWRATWRRFPSCSRWSRCPSSSRQCSGA
jgi:amino acid transporter